MDSATYAQTTQVIIDLLVGLYFAYVFFMKRSHSDPGVMALEEKRRNQMLWVFYILPAATIVAYPVFILLYPNDLDLVSDKVMQILRPVSRLLLIPLIIINVNYFRKKKRLIKEIEENNQAS